MFYVFNTTQQAVLIQKRCYATSGWCVVIREFVRDRWRTGEGQMKDRWGTGELQTQLYTSAHGRVQGHAVTDCGKVVSDNRCRVVTRGLNGVKHDRADGPRAGYFGLELGAKTIRRQISQQTSRLENAYFVESHDVGLSLRSLNLLSICCVGPKKNKNSSKPSTNVPGANYDPA